MVEFSSAHSASYALVGRLFKSVYIQMAAALAVTGLTAWFVASSPAILEYIFMHPASIWILLIAEFGLVLWLSARVMHMSMGTATLLFILYSVLTGVTFSTIFLVYTGETIATTFFVTAGTFLAMSIVGYVTRLDLSRMGSLLYTLLIGLIIATLVNIFLKSTMLYWITTYAGVVIFTGLIAWDTQKLKQLFLQFGTADESGHKLALLGALTLYLDFINLFLMLLRILGGNRE
jgi:FtsH-binding integral membrane protein